MCCCEPSGEGLRVYTSSDSAIINAPQDSGKELTEEEARLFTENSKEATTYSITKATAGAAVLAATDPPNFIEVLLQFGDIKKNQHMMQVGENKRKFGFLFIESAAMAHVLAAKSLMHEVSAGAESPINKDAQSRSTSKSKES
ncbi:hypothetical protein EYC80_009209 [Monilinia laxa]|uniref:RRM domain-containing protein n=1 Tax=Monilinia laxa TaxID=61186 RepID=A0A5N6JX47_MONLA|nr:hypothetical protein EYC80_009209 [Monilinia laxa]